VHDMDFNNNEESISADIMDKETEENS